MMMHGLANAKFKIYLFFKEELCVKQEIKVK